MTGAAKRKGDKAELEAAALLHDLTGHPARRKLGAGRIDDTGDIDGMPDLTVQVANWANTAAAVAQKPGECAQQQQHAGTTFGVTMVRIRGGRWVFVQTAEQFAAMYREATA